MASTKASQNRCAWKYTDDLGNEWAVSAKSVYVLDGTDGAKYGGEAAEATDPQIPSQLRMRAVKMVAGSNPVKYVPAYTVTATIWTTPGTTLTLNLEGVDTVYTAARGHRAEHNPDGIRQTA